uniref:Ashwin n=2 Tax=Electrophorus electricus TaxID=8005 RepID=A0A4W4DNW3_ELEEL
MKSHVLIFRKWKSEMASYRPDGKAGLPDRNVTDSDLLLHPELLSPQFIKLMLHERKIRTEDEDDPDQLTELYIQHVIPLPQRELPNSRWGRRMENTKARQRSTTGHSSSADGRKRPLIVFEGGSAKTGAVKLKKGHDPPIPAVTDRLKPPPCAVDLTNPIRKLSGSCTNCSPSLSSGGSPKSPTGNGSLGTSGSTSAKLKRGASEPGGAPGSPELKSPEVKKKIQHVTWP